MSLISRGSILEALRPGVHAWWGQGYDRYVDEYKQIFDVLNSGLNYERDVNMFGFGMAVVKSEGTPVTYDTMAQGFAYNYSHIPYALAYTISHEAMMDNQYMKLAEVASKSMGNSMKEAKETVGANVLNLAFSNTVTYADGLELCSTANLLSGGGTFRNTLSTAADLSEASLEQAIIDIGGFVDDRSLKSKVMPVKLIVPKELQFEADRLLKSEYRVSTADNDINAIQEGGYLPGGKSVNHYLTDADAWFIKTDCAQGLQHFMRESVKIDMDVEFNTDNILCKFYERYSFGCTDKRGIYGSPGA